MNYEHVAYLTSGAEIVRMSVKDYVDGTNLPEIQIVRGDDMWTADKALAFTRDFVAGKYTPAPTICETVEQDADGNDIKLYLVVDGQQRRKALACALEAGIVTPDVMIDVILVTSDDADDTFRRLNIGVTVAKSIVGTMDYPQDVRDRVNGLASHPLFAALGYSAYSRQNGITSAIVQAAIATVCKYTGKDGEPVPVWDNPNSIYDDARRALKAHAADIPADEWTKVTDILSAINTALEPYFAHVAKYGKTKKETSVARKLISALRKKNLMVSTVDAIGNGGIHAADVLAVLANSERLAYYKDHPYTYTVNVSGTKTTLRAKWTVGSGSSGGSAEFDQRKIILSALCGQLTDADRKMPFTVSGSATADVKDASKSGADAVLDEVGA